MNTLISVGNASEKNKFVDCTSEYDHTFKWFRDLCSKSPVLAYADYSKPFMLHADSCETRLGAVLYQDSRGWFR